MGTTKLRQDCVLLAAECESNETSLWVAKVLALFRINIDGNEESVAFVQFFEATKPCEEIERRLNCVCLKWARFEESVSTSTKSFSKCCDIVPFGAIRSKIHLFSTDVALRGMKP